MFVASVSCLSCFGFLLIPGALIFPFRNLVRRINHPAVITGKRCPHDQGALDIGGYRWWKFGVSSVSFSSNHGSLGSSHKGSPQQVTFRVQIISMGRGQYQINLPHSRTWEQSLKFLESKTLRQDDISGLPHSKLLVPASHAPDRPAAGSRPPWPSGNLPSAALLWVCVVRCSLLGWFGFGVVFAVAGCVVGVCFWCVALWL